MTTLNLTRTNRHANFLLSDAAGNPCGVLHTGRALRYGEATADHDRWVLSACGRGRRHTTADSGGQQVASLNPPAAQLPGRNRRAQPEPGFGGGEHASSSPREVRWSVGRNLRRYRAVLTDGAATVTVLLPAFGRPHCQIEVTGDWPHRNLVILTACYSLLVRRRRGLLLAMAVGAATSG